jgi:hypothetical protein
MALEQQVDCEERGGADEQRSRRASEAGVPVRRSNCSNATATTSAPAAKARIPAASRFGGVRKQPSAAPTRSAPPVAAA